MSDNVNRLDLWRNTIQLFHQYKNLNFRGPFKKIEFEYLIEQKVRTKREGKIRDVDILASSEDCWMILELTIGESSKMDQLKDYKTADPVVLNSKSIPTNSGCPDVLSSRLKFVDDGEFCQLIVKDELKVRKKEFLENEKLKETLKETEGINLEKTPDLPISFVPEMERENIRKGLIDIIMEIFEPESEGKKPMDMVNEGLERLSDKVSITEKQSLRDKIKGEMDKLVRNHLEDYLIFEDGVYKTTDHFKDHHQSRLRISKELRDWAGEEEEGQQLLEKYGLEI